jgi:MSHA biogenesis protein MshM
MYYAHFGLKEPPFKITPNTEVFFTGGNRGAVLDALIYAINNGEGIVKVVGEVGSGKTMLCRMLQTMLPEKVESIYLANPSVAPEDVMHAIAFELQLKLPKNADRLKVMQVLQTHLLARHAAGKQVVIFVEEAQGMPIATLEQIRLLSNLETNHDKLLQIVLFGQPELDENLNQTHIRQLRERITHSFNLAPLPAKEIGEYLIFRLRAAGYFGPHLFTNTAISKIATSAEGLVRRVNILADKALLAAFAENVYQVMPKHVNAAIADSEFGAEKLKANAKKTQLLMWLGLLLVALGLGYTLNFWAASYWPRWQASVAENPPKINVAKVAVKPMPAAKPETPLQTQPSAVMVTVDTAPALVASSAPSPQPSIDAQGTSVAPTHIVSSPVVITQDAPVQATPIAVAPVQSPAAPPAQSPLAPALPTPATPVAATAIVPPVSSAVLASPPAPAIPAPPSTAANPPDDILSRRLNITSAWLANQPPSTVSIQLMGASSDEQLKGQLEMLSQKIELDNLYVYRTKANNQPFLSVLYGSFADRSEAMRALQKLPTDLQKNHPHLRTVAGVLQEIK